MQTMPGAALTGTDSSLSIARGGQQSRKKTDPRGIETRTQFITATLEERNETPLRFGQRPSMS
jgi:hypothetical protein